MDKCVLLVLTCVILSTSAWSPYYPVRAPVRVVRYAPQPHHHPPSQPHHHRTPVHAIHEPIRVVEPEPIRAVHEPSDQDPPQWQRPKRGHHDYDDHRGSSGVTGPVHTFVKTDKNANYKWGVRHHVGDKFSS